MHRKWLHRLAPILLALALSSIVLLTLGDYGITWDENFYIEASDTYMAWLQNPTLATIDGPADAGACLHWCANHERPPLLKVLSGLGKLLFHDILGWTGVIVGYRLAVVPFVFALCWALYAWARELYGDFVALLVTLSFFLLPRAFFHAHLVALDYATTALGLLVAYAYWKEVRRRRWPWVTAVLLGLMLLTKINGLFLYPLLLACWAVFHRRQLLWRILGKGADDPRARARCYLRLVPLFTIPPALFIAGWPWLWPDLPGRTLDYLSYHAGHFAIPVYYLGSTHVIAPWHYPFVQFGVTTPPVTLVAILAGLVGITLRRAWGDYLWIGLNAALTIVLLIPPVPKYDNIRLMLPALPFLCLVAGAGLHYGAQLVRPVRARQAALAGYLVLLLVSGYLAVVRTHPYQSSYYSEAVGGVDGAVRLGFEADYWGNAYRGLLPWLREHADETFWLPRAATDPYLYKGFALYAQDGLLADPVRFGGREDSAFMILLVRQGHFTPEMWAYYTEEEPVFAVRLSETVLAGIYRLRR